MIRGLWFCLAAIIFALAAMAEDDSEREGGIVGTGIVGAITDLGSIFVNGQRIHFAENKPVHSSFGMRTARSLVPGETVVIEASRKDGEWQADRITHYMPAIGPVSQSASADIAVLGSDIIILPDTTLVGFGDNGRPRPGDWIAVNGLWRDKTVIATRIIRIDPLPEAVLMGTYEKGERDNTFLIGGTLVDGLNIRHAAVGDALTVTGVPAGNGLDVRTVAVGLFSRSMNRVLMEGYLSEPDGTGRYTIHGSGITSYREDEDATMSFDRGLYCASGSKEATIQPVIETLPEDKSGRQKMLQRLADDINRLCPN